MNGGDDRAERALGVFLSAGDRLLIGNLCCTIPEENFVEDVANSLSTECNISLEVANLIATSLKLHDRRFPAVEAHLESLIVDEAYSLCGVEVDSDFSACLLTALNSSVHINGNSISPADAPEFLDILNKCFVGMEGRTDADPITKAAFKSLQRIDSSIISRTLTANSVYTHAYRLAHRLWYDTGVLCDEIIPSLKMLACRVAHSLYNYKRFAPVIGLHLTTISNLVDLILDSEILLADELEHASIMSYNALDRLCRAAKSLGADVGLMLHLDEYDEKDLHFTLSKVPEMITFFENCSLEVLDSGKLIRHSTNKYGGTMATKSIPSSNGSVATVADPTRSVKEETLSLFDKITN
jgi:hypothetical protein